MENKKEDLTEYVKLKTHEIFGIPDIAWEALEPKQRNEFRDYIDRIYADCTKKAIFILSELQSTRYQEETLKTKTLSNFLLLEFARGLKSKPVNFGKGNPN